MKQIEILEFYLTALTTCFDPHSTYMAPESAEDFDIQMRLSLFGIGASLKSEDGYTVVNEVMPLGPAGIDGRLKAKDKIIGVGQGTGEIEKVFEIRLSDVVRKIRGEVGTKVRLEVLTDLKRETVIYELTRDKVLLTESEAKGEIIETKDRLGRPGRVGVISLPSFYRDFSAAEGQAKSAAVDVEKILNDFNEAGNVDAVVMDLRGNGGGALVEAQEISGHFIDQGPVVQVKETNGKIRELDDEIPGALYTGPLIVICNRMSASASEIFAGVIKDYHRGIVIGDTTTHGKGTVQNLMPVSARQPFRVLGGGTDRGRLKLTIQQFYRVNGDSTQNRGVRSDVVLPSILDHLDEGEAGLDNALPFDQIRNARYSAGKQVPSELVATLQKNSEVRMTANEDFKKVEQGIQRFIERKNRKEISLQESVLRAERDTDKAITDEEKKQTGEVEEKKKDEEIFPKNFYNDELLNVSLDYVAGLKGQLTVKK